MRKTKPTIEKGSEDRGTGQFRHRQSKSRNFIRKKENPAGRSKDINNDFFDLVPQGQTELFANLLEAFYYICGIKFQKNVIDVEYSVKNLMKPALSAPIEPAFKAGKTALTMVQKGIMEAKIKNF